jgi:MFS family permease
MALSLPQELTYTEETILSSGLSVRRSFLGLNSTLWRLALVTGIAQFSVSIWIWNFVIFLEPIIDPWLLGLTLAAGTFTTLFGYPIAGLLADKIGRRRTLVFSFIPQIMGLVLLFIYPVWPVVLVAYGLHSFGWSFVLVISRAMPADEIANETAPKASRKLTMVLMPSFLVDGISPIFAVLLMTVGLGMGTLLLVGALAAGVSMIVSGLLVKESSKFIKNRNQEVKVNAPLTKLGRPFWKFTTVMLGYYMAWGMAIPYLGILCVTEWGINVEIYGLTWSAFSLTSVSLMYNLSGLTGRNIKAALLVSLSGNGMIMALLGAGSGVLLLFALNILWAAPIVVWISAEAVLSINGVPEEMKGRALGVFQLLISIIGLVAAPLGAIVWTLSGSLRFVWILAGVLSAIFAVLIWKLMRGVRLHNLKPSKSQAKVIGASMDLQ